MLQRAKLEGFISPTNSKFIQNSNEIYEDIIRQMKTQTIL